MAPRAAAPVKDTALKSHAKILSVKRREKITLLYYRNPASLDNALACASHDPVHKGFGFSVEGNAFSGYQYKGTGNLVGAGYHIGSTWDNAANVQGLNGRIQGTKRDITDCVSVAGYFGFDCACTVKLDCALD
jgi:hypothetical protein